MIRLNTMTKHHLPNAAPNAANKPFQSLGPFLFLSPNVSADVAAAVPPGRSCPQFCWKSTQKGTSSDIPSRGDQHFPDIFLQTGGAKRAYPLDSLFWSAQQQHICKDWLGMDKHIFIYLSCRSTDFTKTWKVRLIRGPRQKRKSLGKTFEQEQVNSRSTFEG